MDVMKMARLKHIQFPSIRMSLKNQMDMMTMAQLQHLQFHSTQTSTLKTQGIAKFAMKSTRVRIRFSYYRANIFSTEIAS
jgi:hypothetical protein